MDYKPSLKGAWLLHVTLKEFFFLGGGASISQELMKLELSNFAQWFTRWRFSTGITNCPLNGRGNGHVTSLNLRK